ncbi:MAG: hypothetical protein UU08_C0017G0012 [Candidatus Uhrbacteria bacterium GW2011_GWE2_40_58]|nr:MAG: hypothetical protein UT94_C0019G0012 [Candidatus Uhrbacteria bacterium GW2011_GWF2_40_263]KKR67453.1 MAG: hypothetical protein UU08_C0017G0012 [Candidatus Uhrbacteria bacterium GW2011_GWE2_40_58]OGL94460.1 MAG: hypothetical protein A2239_01210 [Candidatus Uhrbacteria bacterium RIFOXYA2_FULL_40_9]OGL98292.1 MAG: hypothetical protein A2332_05045 [Candidatus Uhrbacteria bacterium RIFOXYB2_FULL_41_18]HCB55704.1 hypothetical protein [Candidatus Uhrbacteria bacterium]
MNHRSYALVARVTSPHLLNVPSLRSSWDSRCVQRLKLQTPLVELMKCFEMDVDLAKDFKRALQIMTISEAVARGQSEESAFQICVKSLLTRVPFAGTLIPYHLFAWACVYGCEFPDVQTMRTIMEGIYQRLLPLLSKKGRSAQTEIYWKKSLELYWWFGQHLLCEPKALTQTDDRIHAKAFLAAVDLFAEIDSSVMPCRYLRATSLATRLMISESSVKQFLQQQGIERLDDLNQWMMDGVIDDLFLTRLIEFPDLVRALAYDQMVKLAYFSRKHPEKNNLLELAYEYRSALTTTPPLS